MPRRLYCEHCGCASDDGRTIARGWLLLRPGPLSGARTADQCAHLPLPPLPEGHGLAVLCARPISHGPGDGDGSDGALPIVTRALARLLPYVRHSRAGGAAQRRALGDCARCIRRSERACARVPLFRGLQAGVGAPQRRLAAIRGMAA